MSERWIVQLERASLNHLAALRCVPGLSVCEVEGIVWLMADHPAEELHLQLRAIPGARRYRVLDDDQLLPAGANVPQGRLPSGSWTPLRTWVELELAAPRFPAEAPPPIQLQLVRTDDLAPTNVLLTTLACWHDFAIQAPQLRLDRLVFAVDDQRRVIVRGTPLPPIPGVTFVERQGIAVPAGWRWEPMVDADVLREVCRLESEDLAFWHPDGSWEVVRGESFVKAGRAAVRESLGELTHE